jgi:gliding motility-associated-like protein
LKLTSKIYLLLILFISLNINSFSQINISGKINSYAAIDSVYPSSDTIKVNDALNFSANDTVMLMQMQGATVQSDTVTNPHLFGQITDKASAGKYEIIIIKAVNQIQNIIVFNTLLLNNYNIKEGVQLIKIPSYYNAIVNSELTCDAWNGSTGGVLAIIVNDTLFVDDLISSNAKGFRGADLVNSSGDCAESDSAYYRSYYFDDSETEAGKKGEGIAKNSDEYMKGMGAWANAGGGGNARFSGGGGGSNGEVGGPGGNDDVLCNTPAYSVPYWEGLGGRKGYKLYFAVNDSTVFMGGGGGSGTQSGAYSASNGGNGGGIIIILAETIVSNNGSISSNGENVEGTVTASGGGGGGAGSIILDVADYINDLQIDIIGGNGGWTSPLGASYTGPGGGGSGGMLLFANSSLPANVTSNLSGGIEGKIEDEPTTDFGAFPGVSGNTRSNIILPLRGFLFNTINEDQVICFNDIPQQIKGSTPKGGNGIFSYIWKLKTKLSASWEYAPGTNDSQNYQAMALTDTTYFKRVVQSGSVIDSGNIVTVIVQPLIINNNISGIDTICYGNEADSLYGTTVKIGGDGVGTYIYSWQARTFETSWNDISVENDTLCLPGTLFDTTLFRRTIYSGVCYDTSASVEIVNLPLIENNNISSNQTICLGQQPEEIIGEMPDNGLGIGSYNYAWEKSYDGTNWNSIIDSVRQNYYPSNLVSSTYYRRIVVSGDCDDISEAVFINVLPKITNNSIENGNLIYTCLGTAPDNLTGTAPEGGNNNYNYQWQKSADNLVWNNITTDGTSEDYQPEELTQLTYYRRIVHSGLNDCCIDVSDAITIDIHQLPIAAMQILDTSICSNEEIELLFNTTAGLPPYNLVYSNSETTYTINDFSSENVSDIINPSTDNVQKEFTYSILSLTDNNACEATDITGSVTIKVYAWPNSLAGDDSDVCELQYSLDASKSIGDGIWSLISENGEVAFADSSIANTSVEVSNAGYYRLKWTETNWQCADSDSVQIHFYQSPFNINAGNDTVLFFENEFLLNGQIQNPDNEIPISSLWEFLEGSGNIADEDSSETLMSNLYASFNKQIALKWSVSKGVCSDIADTLYITINNVETPTGFSPNGDNINETLVIKGIDNGLDNRIIIYNRWGTEVYRKNNYSNDDGWNGKNQTGKDLPEDTYYYILSVEDVNNLTHLHKGYIVIKR